MNPIDIIRYIVWYASQNDIRLTTNRLVKFIYLVDLYNARLKDGDTLTGFPWKFIHYGPYCSEAMDFIEQAVHQNLINMETYDSLYQADNDYHMFSCNDENADNLKDSFHIGVLVQIQKVIKKFGDDTPQLLDYVYFHTEPMMGVKKGDLLDFSKVEKFASIPIVKLNKLSPQSIRHAREQIKKLGEALDADRHNLNQDNEETDKYKDESYFKFIEMLDGDELVVGLKGTSKIQITE